MPAGFSGDRRGSADCVVILRHQDLDLCEVPTAFNASGIPNGGYTTCAYHVAVWTNMGMVPAHEYGDAVTCAGQTPHASVIQGPINAPRWAPLFE